MKKYEVAKVFWDTLYIHTNNIDIHIGIVHIKKNEVVLQYY
jgi:hypothetical protein